VRHRVKLVQLDTAEFLAELRVPPGNRLETLRADRVGQHRLAKGIRVPPRRINEIVHGKRGITADTALRRGRFFGTSERFWLNLQNRYDLEPAFVDASCEKKNGGVSREGMRRRHGSGRAAGRRSRAR
jgi:addiction module HigA family antidote